MSTIVGQSAPDFYLQTADGNEVLFSSLGTEPTIINVFHSGCPWCRSEMPKIGATYRRHPTLGVRVLGIAVGLDTPQTARAFAQEQDLDFVIGVDARGEMRRSYGLGRVPAIIVIDRNGIVVRVYEGWAEQLPGIVEQTMLSLARGDELPDYSLIGNGCALD